jgi:predicted Zn-dependent protease
MTAGLAINPPTPVERILPHLGSVDLALVMSVNPGFSGQSFIESVLDKTRAIADELQPDQRLQMDGGIKPSNAPAVREAGCDVLVAASAIYGLPVAKRAAMLYAGVMAYTQQRRAAQAREAMNTLLQLVREDPAGLRAAQWLAADTERRLNNPLQCLQSLGAKVVDRSRVMLQTLCRIEAKQATLATQASDTMQLWLAQNPRDALAWDLSSQALMQTGDRLRGLRADAEFHVVRWDEVGAIDRFRAAQDLAKQLAKDGKLDRAGHMEASFVDSRLRALERKRLELLQPY